MLASIAQMLLRLIIIKAKNWSIINYFKVLEINQIRKKQERI